VEFSPITRGFLIFWDVASSAAFHNPDERIADFDTQRNALPSAFQQQLWERFTLNEPSSLEGGEWEGIPRPAIERIPVGRAMIRSSSILRCDMVAGIHDFGRPAGKT
jgi:hypothetical protein